MEPPKKNQDKFSFHVMSNLNHEVNLQEEFKKLYPETSYPCFVLNRETWNDFGVFSKFSVYLSENADHFQYLGSIKIIHKDMHLEDDGIYSKLPESFEELDVSMYFSSCGEFLLDSLNNEFKHYKVHFMNAVNEINFMGYNEDFFQKNHPNLYTIYKSSLLRDYWEDHQVPSDYYSSSIDSLNKIAKEVMELDEDAKTYVFYRNLFHSSCITILEVFLQDAIKNAINNNINLLFALYRDYVKSTPSEKNFLSTKGIRGDNIIEEIRKECNAELDKVLYHNLHKVSSLYWVVLGFHLPASSRKLFKAIELRHDIVHRNGKNKHGVLIEFKRQDLADLIFNIRSFINTTERMIKSVS